MECKTTSGPRLWCLIYLFSIHFQNCVQLKCPKHLVSYFIPNCLSLGTRTFRDGHLLNLKQVKTATEQSTFQYSAAKNY